MNDLSSQLVTTMVGLGLLAGGYLLWLLTGVTNAVVNTKTWSWKKTIADLSKALLMGVVILGLVALSNGLEWYAGLLGFDVTEFTDGVSIVTLIGGIVAGIATYYGRAMKNALNFFKLTTSAKQIEGTTPDFKAVAEGTMDIVNGIVTALYTPKEVVEEHKDFEIEGGLGAVYVVPVNTYDAFRNAVMGKGYDVDGAFGYQCWDGAALLWQQFGLSLITGNGCAAGCWTLKKDVNKYDKFELITDVKKVKRGDVLVFSTGKYGHIGFADEDYNNPNSIRFLGQNQGGTPKGAAGGAGFNVINMSLATFLGAFRLKAWATSTPTTAPADKVQETIDSNKKDAEDKSNAKIKVGDKVVPIKLVDYDGRRLRKYDDSYTVTSYSGDRYVLSARGQIWAAVALDNLRKL